MNSSTLEELHQAIWGELQVSAHQNHTPYRFLNLSTVNGSFEPECRYVVLRDITIAQRQLFIHTDIRSEKIAQLQLNAHVALSGYDTDNKVQLRLKGACKIFNQDKMTQKQLEEMSAEAKHLYGLILPSGIEGDKDIQLHTKYDPDAAAANFAILQIQISQIKWLQLGQTYHSAAKFDYDSDGRIRHMAWIMP